jgi:hypothetical protein
MASLLRSLGKNNSNVELVRTYLTSVGIHFQGIAKHCGRNYWKIKCSRCDDILTLRPSTIKIDNYCVYCYRGGKSDDVYTLDSENWVVFDNKRNYQLKDDQASFFRQLKGRRGMLGLYPIIDSNGSVKTHNLMGNMFGKDISQDMLNKGWDGREKLVWCHINDNPLDFRGENLIKAPEIFNHHMRKVQIKKKELKKGGSSFFIQFRVNNRPATVTANNEHDCWDKYYKTKMAMLPVWERDFWFEYCVPPGLYESVEKMINGISIKEYDVDVRRKSKGILEILPFKEWSEQVKQELLQSEYTFDSKLDVVIRYIGYKKATFDFICSLQHNEQHILEALKGKRISRYGNRMYIDNNTAQRFFANAEKYDNQIVRHEGYNKVDFRYRVLKSGTHSQNMRDRKRKRDDYVEKRIREKIRMLIGGKRVTIHIGVFSNSFDANQAHQRARDLIEDYEKTHTFDERNEDDIRNILGLKKKREYGKLMF